MKAKRLSIRWVYLAVATLSMLFAGIIYAWSILKTPLAAEFHWDASQLTVNFTLTMCFFCVGGFLGSQLTKKIQPSLAIILAGILAGTGFVCTSLLSGNIVLLYVAYAGAAGLGIGIAYNVIISTVSAWFPDKRGLASGFLLMGFGVSTMLFGTILDAMFVTPSLGWRTTFLIFGIAIALVLVIAGIIIKRPDPQMQFPPAKKSSTSRKEEFEAKEYTTGAMIKRFTFWRAFICLTFILAVGSSVISFARDLAISVNASPALATTLVGILSVCNGLGRILAGAAFDAVGRRITMLASNLLAILAAGLLLGAIMLQSLPLCIVGLCLSGLSYGSVPTIGSVFVSSFYGSKYFSTNYSIVTFNLMAASFVATACSSLLVSSGTYITPFILLLALAAGALILNLSIKRP